MNDEDLKDFVALAISEPHARNIDGKVVTSPMGHRNWTKMIPTCVRDASWPIRSMLWIRSDLEAEQVSVPSADLTVAIVRLERREVMVVSVYVEGKNDEALASAMEVLRDVIDRFRNGTGNRTDMVLAGDFNRHDLLWGGDEVSARRQGEGPDKESTIDLVLASAELADEVISCVIHPTEHGSDHRAIQTTFDIQVPERMFPQRLLLRNAPWVAIAARVEDELRPLPWNPPPYAKRWWTKDLTRLRRTYTYWRNQARAQRRAGQSRPDLEQRAKEAAKEYHDNLRRQKKAHWDDFVTDESNIWKAVKYVKSGTEMTDDKVPPLKRADGSITEGKGEQAEELLSTFFPPLPTRIEPEEIGDKVMAAKPWKAPGEDGLPAMVWKKLWHVVKIIPLRKPVVAERISYAVEAHGLLPANHFGARKRRSADQALRIALTIKGNDIKPKKNVKLLGVIMDKALRFKEHIASAAAKGLAAAMCLKRLKMASPRMARQLAQRIGAQAVTEASAQLQRQWPRPRPECNQFENGTLKQRRNSG
ncbi:endonuclease-reverse transcriptase domain-containing protein [Hirsutella rhossiliensis]